MKHSVEGELRTFLPKNCVLSLCIRCIPKAGNRLAPRRGADLTMYVVSHTEVNYAPIQMCDVVPSPARFDGPTADGSGHAPRCSRSRRAAQLVCMSTLAQLAAHRLP